MRLQTNTSNAGRGWGPFTSRQLTTIVCVAIVAAVMIPTAAMAAIGAFTSTTVTPAVTGTNSATVANAKGVQGTASATSAGVTRYGVAGNASGTLGIGVQGTGTKYGVFSNGPLGVAAGKSLSCTGCVGAPALASGAKSGRLLYTKTLSVQGPWFFDPVASFTVPAGLVCITGTATAYTDTSASTPLLGMKFYFTSDASVSTVLQFFTNESSSHKTLATYSASCVIKPAGTYEVTAGPTVGNTESDANDLGSVTVQVFAQ